MSHQYQYQHPHQHEYPQYYYSGLSLYQPIPSSDSMPKYYNQQQPSGHEAYYGAGSGSGAHHYQPQQQLYQSHGRHQHHDQEPPSHHQADNVPMPMSNTQLKKLRVKEWRDSVRRGELDEEAVARAVISHPCNPPVSPSDLTKQLAIDCEMVGCGPRGCRDMLARVSIVNTSGKLVYDKYVQPREPVTDYRSFVSGIYAHHLMSPSAVPFPVVQREVCDLLKDRILVGHAIKHDLRVLYLSHPQSDIRDTSLFFDSGVYGGRGTPSLRKLTEHYIGVEIQSRAHDSIEDARATMRLYGMFRQQWEQGLAAGTVSASGRGTGSTGNAASGGGNGGSNGRRQQAVKIVGAAHVWQ